MNGHSPEVVLRDAINACTHGDVAAFPDLFTDDVSGWSPTLLVTTLSELVEAMADVDEALSQIEVHVDAIDAFGNKAFAEYRVTGRFTGPFEAEDVVIPPNGQPVELGAVIVAEFTGDKIHAFRNYFDELALLEQLVEPA